MVVKSYLYQKTLKDPPPSVRAPACRDSAVQWVEKSSNSRCTQRGCLKFRHPKPPCDIKSRKSKNHELDRTNLPQNSNFGWEFAQKSGVQIPVGEGQIFLARFLFIFSIKNWILTHKIFFYIFFYQVNINKNRYIEQILFYFYVTC